jgi:hypothetical protein
MTANLQFKNRMSLPDMSENDKTSQAELASEPELMPEPVASYYQAEDIISGNWWNRSVIRRVQFSAEDYEEFSKKFQQMANELMAWQKQYKRKAKVLEVSIFVHPWISKRILQQFKTGFGAGHGYGDFSQKGTIKLHLHDAFDAIGTHYVLYESGKKLQDDKN